MAEPIECIPGIISIHRPMVDGREVDWLRPYLPQDAPAQLELIQPASLSKVAWGEIPDLAWYGEHLLEALPPSAAQERVVVLSGIFHARRGGRHFLKSRDEMLQLEANGAANFFNQYDPERTVFSMVPPAFRLRKNLGEEDIINLRSRSWVSLGRVVVQLDDGQKITL